MVRQIIHYGFHSNSEKVAELMYFHAHSSKLVHLFNRCNSNFLKYNKERFLLRAKLINLVVKITFGFLFQYFPQDNAICLYFAVIPEICQTARLQFRPKPISSCLEVEAKSYFQD